MRSTTWLLVAASLAVWPSAAAAQQGEAPAPTASATAAAKDAPASDAAPTEGAVPEASKELFVQKCASCHTVGEGDRVGPDLKGATERRNDAWLRTMIQTPSRLLDSDPDARELVAEYKGVRMPDLGLTDDQVQAMVDLIATCSETKCDLKGKFVPVTEATAADTAMGVELFLGRTSLENGGPACVSCHTMQGIGSAIQGGTLAKELTHSFATIGDEGLDAALKNPNFPVMNKVYGDSPLTAAEAFALRSVMYDANRGALQQGDSRVSVVLIAVLVALLSLAGLNAAWSHRKYKIVRDTLVTKEQHS